MAYVIWCDMFSINVPYIDNQHRKLIEIANNFHAALKEKKTEKNLFQTLNSLIRYAEKHFRDEEKLMEEAKYPSENFQEHKRIHEKLVEDIFELQQKFTESGAKSVYEIEVFINNWLIKHILYEDKKLQPFCELLRNFRL